VFGLNVTGAENEQGRRLVYRNIREQALISILSLDLSPDPNERERNIVGLKGLCFL
jgi:hypothetical protein